MEKTSNFINNNNKPIEANKILNEVSLVDSEKVSLNREWVFWENYESLKNQAWSETIKELCEFDNIIAFWQFWNSYPGSSTVEVFFNEERVR